MPYTRENPSPRYRELLRLYQDMHKQGEKFLGIPAQSTFSGESLPAQAKRIKRLVKATQASAILDYGSGKGRQYDPQPLKADGAAWDSVVDFWDVDVVTCYDPAYEPFSKLPVEKFDGVICTDVMEHCPEQDIPWIVGEIFGFARRFVFVNAACYPAYKRLPNGENAHCTIRPPEWWETVFRSSAQEHPGVLWELWVTYLPPGGKQREKVERCLGNAGC